MINELGTFDSEAYEKERTISISYAPKFAMVEYDYLLKGHRLIIVQECPDAAGQWRVLLINPCEKENKEIWILKPDGNPGYASQEAAYMVAGLYQGPSDLFRPPNVDPIKPEWDIRDQYNQFETAIFGFNK